MKNNILAGNLSVSQLCLGSMTWGSTNTEAEGHAQIDMFLASGGNFIDTAEMYPVNPILAETCGRSEAVVGTWFAKNKRRDEVVLASKVAGDNPGWVREGRGYDGAVLREAVDASLTRLQTDYIDLFQLHWPMRGGYAFRQNWRYDPSRQSREQTKAHMVDVLEAARDLVASGKVRQFGLSNETTWGTSQWLSVARDIDAPEMISVQNEYSLLHRLADTDLAELCANEGVRVLSYSPLATGLLTGKYQNGAVPAGSRGSLVPGLSGRMTDRAFAAVSSYQAIADRHGIDLVHLALAFSVSRPFMGSTIFGASSVEQLRHILDGKDLVLSAEVLLEIDRVNQVNPLPF